MISPNILLYSSILTYILLKCANFRKIICQNNRESLTLISHTRMCEVIDFLKIHFSEEYFRVVISFKLTMCCRYRISSWRDSKIIYSNTLISAEVLWREFTLTSLHSTDIQVPKSLRWPLRAYPHDQSRRIVMVSA